MTELRRFTSWLSNLSYEARLERFGLKRLPQIAPANSKKGGRTHGSTKKATRTNRPKGGTQCQCLLIAASF